MKSPQNDNQLIRIPLARGCLLILTAGEYARGLLRGKMEKRREANERRPQGVGSIAEVLGEGAGQKGGRGRAL